MKKLMVLFPSSFFSITKVDEDLKQEYDAVLAAGLFDVVLFSYEKWFQEEKLVVRDVPDEERLAIYRGWMIQPDLYERFYKLLLEKNIRLVTEPENYKLMHIFPNIYKQVQNDTAEMRLYPLHSRINVEELKQYFDRFMVKDYVKSVKGTEFPRLFDQTISQKEFDQWMDVFYKYRGDLLTGGICIKEYLDLKHYNGKTNEYRVFYINHEIATVCRNSGQDDNTPEPPKELLERYKDLGSPYYTIDYAELEDSTWRIIEAGDGSVSGLSEGQDYEEYFRMRFRCFQ